jgi:hypothetical protein
MSDRKHSVILREFLGRFGKLSKRHREFSGRVDRSKRCAVVKGSAVKERCAVRRCYSC